MPGDRYIVKKQNIIYSLTIWNFCRVPLALGSLGFNTHGKNTNNYPHIALFRLRINYNNATQILVLE